MGSPWGWAGALLRLIGGRPRPPAAESEVTREPIPEGPLLSITGAMLTHCGLVRSHNEDSVGYSLPEAGDLPGRALFVVADGMGGHAAGEVASHLAVETIFRLYREDGSPLPERLARCFRSANALIYQKARAEPAWAGMGTTCTALALAGNRLFLGHIGDSRAYLIRDGQAHQISRDHTLVAELVEKGVLTAAEAARSPERNVLTRAFGVRIDSGYEVDPVGLPLQAGDCLLVCSDGLHDLVSPPQMVALIGPQSPYDACQSLVEAALQAGGHDNISAGILRLSLPSLPELAAKERPTRPAAGPAEEVAPDSGPPEPDRLAHESPI